MFKKLKKCETDIWAVGIVKAKASSFLSNPTPDDIKWITPDKSFQFIADPHGIWRDDKLYIFVEALDYRVKKGEIDCLTLDKDLNLLERSCVLREKTHLSYPFIIEEGGEIYMIPESSRDTDTWIYRAIDFPHTWEKIKPVIAGVPMIDGSFLKHHNQWWVFYALPGADQRSCRELHIAYADDLLGPWQVHKNNPVSTDKALSRPGGRPFIHDDHIHLPVQHCVDAYGEHINILRIDELTPTSYKATKVQEIKPTFHPKYPDGMHSFSACGDVTLIDCKYFDECSYRCVIDFQRRLGRFLPFIRKF